jgi:hypothetical protein
MSTETKDTLRADLNELLAGVPSLSALRCVCRIVSRLQFWGASPSEYRGISDAGLSDEQLNAVLSFGSGLWHRHDECWGLSSDICEHLLVCED